MKFLTKDEFKELNVVDQYKYIVTISEHGVMVLDNDCTYFRMNDESLDLSYDMDNDCGDRSGVSIILSLLGISSEDC